MTRNSAPHASSRRSAVLAFAYVLSILPAFQSPTGAQEAEAPLALEARPFFFALSVQDVEKSAAWYERVFGFHPQRSIEMADRGIRVRLLSQDGGFLEIVEIPEAREPIELDTSLEKRQLLHGVFKIGFEVADLDQTLARLESLNVELRNQPITETDGSMRSAQVLDPDDIVVQLFEILD